VAQPAEPIVSVGELPSRAPAQAPSCWLTGPISIASSADAPSGLDSAIVTAMAPATIAGRNPVRRRGNFTGREPFDDRRTSAAHLGVRAGRKQTGAVTQGGKAVRSQIVEPGLGGKSWPALGSSGGM